MNPVHLLHLHRRRRQRTGSGASFFGESNPATCGQLSFPPTPDTQPPDLEPMERHPLSASPTPVNQNPKKDRPLPQPIPFDPPSRRQSSDGIPTGVALVSSISNFASSCVTVGLLSRLINPESLSSSANPSVTTYCDPTVNPHILRKTFCGIA